MTEARYLYFTPRGKWKYEGCGKTLKSLKPGNKVSHDVLRHLNEGEMPGISYDGKDLTVVVVCEETWPRMILAEVDL